MDNLSSMGLDLALAKRVAVDIKAGLMEKEALLPFKDLVLDRDFGAFLDRLDSRLVRFLNLARRSGMDLNPIQNYAPKGKDIHLYSPPLPGEAQLRLAYEVALEAFLDYLETRGFAVLERRLGVYKLYAPKGFDLEKEWKGFLESYLSLEGLLSSLGLLLESGRFVPRGFSAPKVPLATEGMHLFLGGWYLASL